MAETINGLNDAVLNRETISFTPGVGGEYGGKYEGPYLKVKAKMTELIALGYAVQYECDASPVASVTFKTPSNSQNNTQPPTNPNIDYVDNFQVVRNTVSKELLMSDHPYVVALSSDNFNVLKAAMQSPPVNASPAFTGATITKALYLWELFLNGVRSVEVKQPILRVTRVTNPLYDAPFDLDYVDRILTSSQMISDSKVPSNFVIGLIELAKACAHTTINYSQDVVRPDSLQLRYGWLKDAPTSETVGTTKNQYVLEYKFGLWDRQLYKIA